jgi:hypothetical protein
MKMKILGKKDNKEKKGRYELKFEEIKDDEKKIVALQFQDRKMKIH